MSKFVEFWETAPSGGNALWKEFRQNDRLKSDGKDAEIQDVISARRCISPAAPRGPSRGGPGRPRRPPRAPGTAEDAHPRLSAADGNFRLDGAGKLWYTIICVRLGRPAPCLPALV